MPDDKELETPYKEMAEIARLYRIVTGYAERQWIASKVAADDADELEKLKEGAAAPMPKGKKHGKEEK